VRSSPIKLSIVALSLAVGIAACRDANAKNTATQDELKRDLELAASATINLAAPKVDSSLLTLEGQPQATPQASRVVRRGAGNRAIRSQTPTVRAEPVVEVAAVEESDATETLADAPSPDNGEPVAVAPRPAPVVIQTGGAGDYGSGGGIFGGGSGGGVVIRGGGVDGDNCELHRRGGRRGGPPIIPQTPAPQAGGVPRPIGILTGMGGGFGVGRRAGSASVPRTSSGMQTGSRSGPFGRRAR
jgi:hypothetical protein